MCALGFLAKTPAVPRRGRPFSGVEFLATILALIGTLGNHHIVERYLDTRPYVLFC